jgi:hypothetical protein
VPGLELGWWAVAQPRVQALAVVDLLDEGADAARRLGAIAIACAVDFLGLERLDDQPYRASILNRWYMGTALNVVDLSRRPHH